METATTAQDVSSKKNTVRAWCDTAAIALVAALVWYATYLVFIVVPNERIMGAVQRIFYFHVASAVACYCSVALVLVGGLGYLATHRRSFDALAEAAAEVGFIFCTIVMATGMIWARPIWNTWFNWEPRLVTFLLLWLIFIALNVLRLFGDKEKVPSHCAVLGIVAAVTVPLVVYSIKLLPQFAQLHPQVIENRGLREPIFAYALSVSMLAVVLLQFLLVWFRTRMAKARLVIELLPQER